MNLLEIIYLRRLEECMMNNNKKLIYLFFDETTIIKKNDETKIFPEGEYIATEDEYNKFDLEEYKKITLSFIHNMEIDDDDDKKQILEPNEEYSMPKYKFDELNFLKTSWGELTLDCVLKNFLELPFDAFNYLNNTALDRIGKIFFDDDYNKLVKLPPQTSCEEIKKQAIEQTKKYEEEKYTRIVNQRPELIVFLNIRFLYEKLILDKSENIFKTCFRKYVKDVKNLHLSNLYSHDFNKFLANIKRFSDSDEITGLKKNPNEILWDFIEFFFENNPKSSNLALICLCIEQMDSDYLTSKFFSGEQNTILEIYDLLFEDGVFTDLAKKKFRHQVTYKKTNMPLYSEFFACLISKLKYKPEYKDKFLELIFFGGYKNYDGEYEFPAYENQDKIDWENKLELLRFIDPNFIRDNLDNNLVQKYLKTASHKYKQIHEDCLKKIAEYSENFHGNLESKEDYLFKLVKLGLIEYVDTKFICENIDNEIIQSSLSDIQSTDKQDALFNYFYGLYKEKNDPEEIKAIDKHIYMLMNYYEYIIWHLDDNLIINNLNKSYIRDNIYRIYDKDRRQKICNKLNNQYLNATGEQNEQKQKIMENVLFLIQAKYCGHYIDYFDNDFIIELLFGKGGDTVTNYFRNINEKKAQELCSKLCEKYEESTDDEKTKCERYILQLIKNDYYDRHVANYLSGEFVLDHIENDIIKQKKPRLISNTCQELCSKYSESQGEKKENYKNIIINLLKQRYLDVQYLSPEFIVECVFEDKWLKNIDRYLGDDVNQALIKLVEYLCNKYENIKNEVEKNNYTSKISQLIKVHWLAVCYLSVKFIAENFDTDIIKDNLKKINDPEKQKELYDYFYGEYNKAKNDKNEKLENINKSRIIKLINEHKDVILNANVDIEFICENWKDVVNSLQNLEPEYVNDKIRQHLKEKYLFNGNNEPDFGKQEKNKDEVLEWTKEINELINFLHPKFIADNLSDEVILSKLHYLNNENLNSLYDYICNNYGDKEKKNKILVLIQKCRSFDYFISKHFLYDNFNEEIVQQYIFKHIDWNNERFGLWQTLYKCYLSDNAKEAGKQKLLKFIETCSREIRFWCWYDEIDIPFVCDCLNEDIIQELINDLRISVNHNRYYAETKMKEMFEYLCKAQKEYETRQIGQDRTADILKLIDVFGYGYGYGIKYVNAEFIYKNFDMEEIQNNLKHITASQGEELVDCIKKDSKEDDFEKYFLTLIEQVYGFAYYIDMKWIYKHLDNKTIQRRLYLISPNEHMQELYNCIVTSETSDENKKKYILIIANSYRYADFAELPYRYESALTKFLCVIDTKFILDNLDDSQDTSIKEMVKLYLSSYDDFYCKYNSDLARKFALRKLICAIELVEDKLEQDKLYLKLLESLNYSTNVFRYTSAKFLEDRVDSKNEDIKKYIAENISVRTYQYEYGKNAETIEKSENINKGNEFIVYLFDDISENNKDNNKFLEEALKYIKAYEIHDLSLLAEICENMLACSEIWDAFTKFIDECKTYDSSFFGKLLKKTDPNKNLALKLINSEYFSDKNKDDKQSCQDFFGRVLKFVDEYDDNYYKNFVCKLIDINSKFVIEHINKKFLAANCEKPELKKLINPQEKNYALTKNGAIEMFKYLDPKNERDKKIILEHINLNAVFCKYVSDEFLIENWDNKNIQYEITRRIIESISIEGEHGLFNFLDVIKKRTDLDAEAKKQASLKLLSFDTSGYKLIDDKRNLDFVIDNIGCEEIKAQLKKYLQDNNDYTNYKKYILLKIQRKTEKDGWDEKRRENAILILISCDYSAAVKCIDIKFLMSHDKGKAAIKDQVFCNECYKSEYDCFNRVLKYLKRKTEKDGWNDKQKKDFISDLILNGEEKLYRIESIAFNLNKPLVQDFMKDHLNPDDEIFKKLVNCLNKGYRTDKRKYFENRIFYLISLQPKFVIDYVDPRFLLNNIKKDLIKSGLKKYDYENADIFNSRFIIDLALYNLDLIKKNNAYVRLIIDEINEGEYQSVVNECLRDFFGSDKIFCNQIFFALENQLYSGCNGNSVNFKDWISTTFLKLISSNPTRIIEWMISDADKHYNKNVEFLIDQIDQPDVLNSIVTLCSKNENHDGIQKIFNELTKQIVFLHCDQICNYSLYAAKNILRDKKNSTFLQKYLIYVNQLNDIDKKSGILDVLKKWDVDLSELEHEGKKSENNQDDNKNKLKLKNNTIKKTSEKTIDDINKSNETKTIKIESLDIISDSNDNINGNGNGMNPATKKIHEMINPTRSINPKIDLNKNQNKNQNNRTEEEIIYEGIARDQNNLPKQNDKIQNQSQKIIVSDNNNSINQEKQSPPKPNLFKAKILHNPLAFAIGFIILSILFGVIGFAAKITLLYIIGAAVLFIGIVFLLAWSIKKYRKKSNDIRKINVLQNDYPEETQTKENIRSEYQLNEYEINTESPLQMPQNNVK